MMNIEKWWETNKTKGIYINANLDSTLTVSLLIIPELFSDNMVSGHNILLLNYVLIFSLFSSCLNSLFNGRRRSQPLFHNTRFYHNLV